MVFLKSWEDFEIAAESMYLSNPSKCRYTMKYANSKKCMVLKVTDNIKCVQFKTEVLFDLKKIEKFTSNLVQHMTTFEN